MSQQKSFFSKRNYSFQITTTKESTPNTTTRKKESHPLDIPKMKPINSKNGKPNTLKSKSFGSIFPNMKTEAIKKSDQISKEAKYLPSRYFLTSYFDDKGKTFRNNGDAKKEKSLSVSYFKKYMNSDNGRTTSMFMSPKEIHLQNQNGKSPKKMRFSLHNEKSEFLKHKKLPPKLSFYEYFQKMGYYSRLKKMKELEIKPAELSHEEIMLKREADMEKLLVEQRDKRYREMISESRKRKLTFNEMCIQLQQALKEMKRLNLKPEDFYNQEVFSNRPFQKPNSYKLIMASKMGNYEEAAKLLKSNRFLVFDFDYFFQTALHWAARRGHHKIAELLINKGADIDAHDIIGRTPLFFAIKYNNKSIMQLLLFRQCNPWSTKEINYNDACINNSDALVYLKKCRKIHILMTMTPSSLRQALWNKEGNILLLESDYIKLEIQRKHRQLALESENLLPDILK